MTASIATGPFSSGRRSIGAPPAERLSLPSDGALERFASVRWIRVRVRKPDVVLDPPVDYAAAIVERTRE